MKEEIVKIIVENLGVLVSAGTTIIIAWIKKRVDIRKLKKEGYLFDNKLKFDSKMGMYYKVPFNGQSQK